VRTLVETHALVGERGAYSLAKELSTVQVPATVQAILAARIDRLPPEGKTLLQTAAVIGKDVPYPLLRGSAKPGDEELRRGLAQLQAGEFLYEASLFPDLEYTFKHALTHEVAYGSLLQDRRRALHGRIVEVLERLYPDRLTEQIERLAHHARHAEAWERAVRYARQAGQKATMRFAHREAAVWRELALGALGHLPDSRENRVEGIDLRFELRAALLALAETSRIPAIVEEAERLAVSIGDQRRLGLALAHLGSHRYETAQDEPAIEYGERAMAIARDLGDPGLEAFTTFLLGQCHGGRGSFGRAIELLGRNVAALETFRPAEDSFLPQPLAVSSRCFLARALAEVGEFGQAAVRAEEAIAASEASDHALGLVNGLLALGATHVRQGDFPRAVSALERGVAIARTRAVVFLVPAVAALLGLGLAQSGRVQEGIALLEEAGRDARAGGRPAMVLGAQQILADVHTLNGRLEEAAALAADALDTTRRIGRRGVEAWVLRGLGDISAAGPAPDLGEAARRYREALDLARQLSMRPLAAHCHRGLGRIDRVAGREEQARENLGTATTMYREMDMRFYLEQAQLDIRRSA